MSTKLYAKAADPNDGGSTFTSVVSDEMIIQPYSDVKVNTPWEIFSHAAKKHPNNKCLGWRPIDLDGKAGPYEWYNYTQVKDLVLKLAKAMSTFNLQKGDRVGVFGKNCPAWSMIEYACIANGFVLVPLYDTLGEQQIQFVCNHSELKVLFIENKVADKFGEAKANCPKIERVVMFDSGDVKCPDSKRHAQVESGDAVTLEDLIESSEPDEASLPKLTLEDLAVIMYTSGTTGDPKGVTVSNLQFVSSVAAALKFFSHYKLDFTETDSLLSYLPLAHIYEQQSELLILTRGGAVGYYQGAIPKLLEDLEALKPTIFVGVPRVYSRFESKIQEAIDQSGGIKKWLINRAIHAQLENVTHVRRRNKFWDKLIFSSIRKKIFPNVRLAISGSAPLAPQTNDFLKMCLMCPIVQGYGLTETVGGLICTAPLVQGSGHNGGPLPCCEVKLIDVPEMEYSVKDKPYPRGEILLRGPAVTGGYYKNDEENKSITADGWFHTGDVGQWLEDKSLQIIDRKKNLFKLAQGEYVSPETLEQGYTKAKLVGQIWIYGNSFESYLVAVCTPDEPQAKAWASKHGKKWTDLATVCKDPVRAAGPLPKNADDASSSEY
mmetsp:Transcript_44752/g.173632  ORF Transcript_44752/g.173632 Transcript_44752/m.173632 type:complete len:604 (-) Transcript_44752:1756-3567(-)